MTDPRGFLRDRSGAARRRTGRSTSGCATTASQHAARRRGPRARAGAAAAWTAACRSATPAARSANLIPDWNDLVQRGRWREAHEQLHATNNFPEFTGQALPGAVRGGVRARAERRRRSRSRRSSWRSPSARSRRAGSCRGRRRVDAGAASASSAPARPGWRPRSSCARAGHAVTVFERDDRRRRAAALRDPRLQAREGGGRPRGSSSSRPRASCSRAASSAAPTWPPTSCAPRHDAVVLATGAQRPARPRACPAASSPASSSRCRT